MTTAWGTPFRATAIELGRSPQVPLPPIMGPDTGTVGSRDRAELFVLWRERLLQSARSHWPQWSRDLPPGETPEDLVDDFLAEKFESVVANGSYGDGQIRRAFANFVCSRLRRIRSGPRRTTRDIEGLSDVPGPGVEIASIVRERLEALELMRSLGPGRGGQVDRGAVLLLDERVLVAVKAVPLVRRGRLPKTPSALAEEVYPWLEEDERRRIRADLATNGELWGRIAPAVDRGEISQIAEVAVIVGIDAATLNQWRHRARVRLLETYGGEVDRLFPNWSRRGGNP